MKTLALGTSIFLLVVVAAFQALAQSTEEQPGSSAPVLGDSASARAEECKADVVTASGRGKFRPFNKTKELEGRGSAMADAVAAWQREVGDKFGEPWKLWSKAKEAKFECVPTKSSEIGGSVIGCTISGRPCAHDGVTADDKTAARPPITPPRPAALHTVAQSGEDKGGGDAARCHGIIAAVGFEQSTQEKALIAAHDAWIARVRFDFGERYTDLSYATDANSVCTASSITPFLKRARFRCKIWARPCPAPLGGAEMLYERQQQEEGD